MYIQYSTLLHPGGCWDRPRTVENTALAVRRSNHSARSHPQNTARSHPHSARSHPPAPHVCVHCMIFTILIRNTLFWRDLTKDISILYLSTRYRHVPAGVWTHNLLHLYLALYLLNVLMLYAITQSKISTYSSLGRYVFGSEISYNKAPPRLPGLGC